MKVYVILFSALILSIQTNSQQKPFNYKKMWNKVDSLENKGLVKSALEIVQTIHKNAKIENNSPQVVKSYIYQIKYRNIIEEDAFETLLKELSNEAKTVSFPYSSLYHTLCAELYWQYYQSNRYRFYNRTYSPDEGDDLRSWSLEHLVDVIIKHHLAALKDKKLLQQEPLSKYSEILTESENTEGLRPTLYDFIAFRAVDFFSNKELTLSKPADSFDLNDSTFFADAKTFITLSFKTTDTLSLQYYGILILQDILRFHINDIKPEAFIDADLKRLNFVYRNSALENKDHLYLSALEKLYHQFSSLPYSNAIAYAVVNQMSSIGNSYNAEDSSTLIYKKYKSRNFFK